MERLNILSVDQARALPTMTGETTTGRNCARLSLKTREVNDMGKFTTHFLATYFIYNIHLGLTRVIVLPEILLELITEE